MIEKGGKSGWQFHYLDYQRSAAKTKTSARWFLIKTSVLRRNNKVISKN